MLSHDIKNLHAAVRMMRNENEELHLNEQQTGLLLDNLSSMLVTAFEMEKHVIADDPCQVVISLEDFRKKSRGPTGGEIA